MNKHMSNHNLVVIISNLSLKSEERKVRKILISTISLNMRLIILWTGGVNSIRMFAVSILKTGRRWMLIPS